MQQRRDFIKNATIGSACVLAGSALTNKANGQSNEPEYSVKITVLERTLNTHWSKEYRGVDGKKCEAFKDGQEFTINSPWEAPEGFCQWAWADIRTFIHLVHQGKYETFVSCCTDGFRPVFFKIERFQV